MKARYVMALCVLANSLDAQLAQEQWRKKEEKNLKAKVIAQKKWLGATTLQELIRARNAAPHFMLDVDVLRPDTGMSALMWATNNSDLPTVRWLLYRGAKLHALDAQGRTALYYARKALKEAVATNNHAKIGAARTIIDLFKREIVNPEMAEAQRRWFDARYLNAFETALRIAPVDKNALDPETGMSALMRASRFLRMTIVPWLLLHDDVNPHTQDAQGRTALNYAQEALKEASAKNNDVDIKKANEAMDLLNKKMAIVQPRPQQATPAPEAIQKALDQVQQAAGAQQQKRKLEEIAKTMPPKKRRLYRGD